jgi:hypothetical protein
MLSVGLETDTSVDMLIRINSVLSIEPALSTRTEHHLVIQTEDFVSVKRS